jgi:hypothetical protein
MGHRYVLFLSPPFYVAIAAGFASLYSRYRWLAAAAAGSTVLLFAAYLPLDLYANQWQEVPREELRPVLRRLDEVIGEDDQIYVYYGALPAYSYYRGNETHRVVLGRHLGESGAPAEAGRIAAGGGDRTTWLVVSHESDGDIDALLAALRSYGLDETLRLFDTNAAAIGVSRNPQQ